MSAQWLAFGSKRARAVLVTLQVVTLLAAWTLLHPAAGGALGMATVYVAVVWAIAGVVVFGAYIGSSLAEVSDLLAAAAFSSAYAVWLVPGMLALTARSPIVNLIGTAVIVNSTRLMVLSRPPKGKSLASRRRHSNVSAAEKASTALFLQSGDTARFSPATLEAMCGGLALQAGVFALYSSYPLPAAVSFVAVTAFWVSTSVTYEASHLRRTARTNYAVPAALMSLLLAITFTAVLLNQTVVRELPQTSASDADAGVQPPGMTRRMLARFGHVPPPPQSSPQDSSSNSHKHTAELVDPSSAQPERQMKGIPGVVLRPPPVHIQKLPTLLAGPRLQLSPGRQSLEFPFSGNYELFRLSSGTLPEGATQESGSPLDAIFGTTNGEPMETVAVQPFDPPLDLTNCGKVLVNVTSAEKFPALVIMQLVTREGVEDAGTDLLGLKGAREQMLEFQVPRVSRPLLVRAIRISFERPAVKNSTNVRIAVRGFTLLTRGF